MSSSLDDVRLAAMMIDGVGPRNSRRRFCVGCRLMETEGGSREFEGVASADAYSTFAA
jgi:hypothetical protein